MSLDQTQTRGENTLLRTVANDYKGFVALSIADYTAWTELYRYLNGPRNADWENANLGPYVARTFSLDGVFIVSRKGRIAYIITASGKRALADARKKARELFGELFEDRR